MYGLENINLWVTLFLNVRDLICLNMVKLFPVLLFNTYIFFFHTVRWFQVRQLNTRNSIKDFSFI